MGAWNLLPILLQQLKIAKLVSIFFNSNKTNIFGEEICSAILSSYGTSSLLLRYSYDLVTRVLKWIIYITDYFNLYV